MITSAKDATTARPGGKAARTRDSLVTGTLETIAATGEFTGEQVAERVGVATATFYAHFATKDHAILACLDQAFDAYEIRMAEVESVELLLDAGLRDTLGQIIRTIAAINDEYRFLLRLARGRIQASKLLREHSRAEEHRAFTATLRFIELGQAAGKIRRGDPELLTATVRTIVEGLDAWTVRSHPAVASTEIPDVLAMYLSPTSVEAP